VSDAASLTPPPYLVGDGSTGVLVLAGSSGRVEVSRCDLLASAGATALSYRWFGESVDRVALESFDDALSTLHERCDRLVVLGVSRGAEAALLLGARHAEVDAVVALAPSDVVWAALSTDRPQRTSWTSAGEPLPFVPYDDTWAAAGSPPEFVGLYEQSLETYADRVPAARIPVERIAGEVVLAAGEDDRVWPACDFADAIAARREAAGLATTVVTHAGAGHRVVLPGEEPASGGRPMARGGTDEADAELGALVWPHVLRALGLSLPTPG
jgi:dienelactone hydrolase